MRGFTLSVKLVCLLIGKLVRCRSLTLDLFTTQLIYRHRLNRPLLRLREVSEKKHYNLHYLLCVVSRRANKTNPYRSCYLSCTVRLHSIDAFAAGILTAILHAPHNLTLFTSLRLYLRLQI